MCYSLEASIIAGVGLATAGTGMVQKSLRYDRQMLLFAAFPLVFSVHQFTEGAVWATLHDDAHAQTFRYIYTLIAFCLWPVLTPCAAAYAETDPERKRVWEFMGGVGIALAFLLILQLFMTPGIELTVVKHSLAYEPAFDRPPPIVHLTYLLLTVVPLVMSRRRGVQLFGLAVFGTFVYALADNRPAWYSLWCMAAAFMSVILALAIQEQRSTDQDRLQTQH